MFNHRTCRWIAMTLIILFLSKDILSLGALAATSNSASKKLSDDYTWELQEYSDYLSRASQNELSKQEIRVDAMKYTQAEHAQSSVCAKEQALSIDTNGFVSWDVDVKQAGMYNLKMKYCVLPDTEGLSTAAECSVSINGEIPFKQCQYLSLPRVYSDSQKITQDENGDDIRPKQYELVTLRDYVAQDATGRVNGYLRFHLKQGKNTVQLHLTKGSIWIKELVLADLSVKDTYKMYLNKMQGKTDSSQNKPVVVQAETPFERSSYTIIAQNDRTSCETFPNSSKVRRLNYLGGENWSNAGDWVAWKMSVPKDGYYTLSMRVLQDVYPGTISSRCLFIDDEIPFSEAQQLEFVYDKNWNQYTVSAEGTSCKFYLTEGEHIITLKNVLGKMSDILSTVSDSLEHLNEDYLRILTYTGASPDIYRDYSFQTLLPDVISDFKKQSINLERVVQKLVQSSGGMGENTSVLLRAVSTLKKMHQDPDTIAKYYALFQSDLSAIGTWLITYSKQPLAIDSLMLSKSSEALPKIKRSFWNNICFQTQLIIYSFFSDYSSRQVAKDDIRVWTCSGRDQSQIIQRLSREKFTSSRGVSVNLSLVAPGTLLPSILSGSGPDVYLSAGGSDPINFAIRGAVLNLQQFSDFDKIAERFSKAALVPFQYKGCTYALPETLSFPVMFYRKDIFSKNKLSVPKTWEDFYKLIGILQNQNMNIGLNWLTAFNLFYYQTNGDYYDPDKTKSMLDSPSSITAFKKTVKLYTTYGLPVEFNFVNRFRNGDMPLGIVDYMSYNQLSVFAPEIKGKWGLAKVPGTVQPDGTVNYTAPSTSTAVIIPISVKNKSGAWEFLKWWTDAQTQSQYSNELETVVDASSRQAASNIKAVAKLSWSAEEFSIIKEQWKLLKGTPEIPGSYYVARTLDFAFNSVYGSGKDASDALEENASDLNEEIERKLREFSSVSLG